MNKKCEFKVEGMHCAACELLIEQKIGELKGIKSVDATLSDQTLTIEYDKKEPNLNEINKSLSKLGYKVVTKEISPNTNHTNTITISKSKIKEYLTGLVIFVLLVFAFFILDRSSLKTLVSVDNNSSLLFFFLFGLIAGSSSCAAMTGSLLLSVTGKFNQIESSKNSKISKSEPHLLFHIGRLASFVFFGGLIGLLGSYITISSSALAVVAIIVSLIMIILGLQMLEVSWAKKIRLSLPKSIGQYAVDTKNIESRFMPFITGVATFFVPCGFTFIVQGLALASGSFFHASSILFVFALGTLPMLLLISLGGIKLGSNSKYSGLFNSIAGFLVVFFAIYNLNSQLNILGLKSLSDISFQGSNNSYDTAQIDESELPPIVNGKQILKMEASAYGYSPSVLKVRAGIPVDWQINDTGTSGCTSAIIADGLIDGIITLKSGINSTVFTAPKPGTYKFSCSMGMVPGLMIAY